MIMSDPAVTENFEESASQVRQNPVNINVPWLGSLLRVPSSTLAGGVAKLIQAVLEHLGLPEAG